MEGPLLRASHLRAVQSKEHLVKPLMLKRLLLYIQNKLLFKSLEEKCSDVHIDRPS